MKLKRYLPAAALMLSLTSCFDDFSDRYVDADNHLINNELSAQYAMMGIMQSLQDVGDSYVILGELRADLMDVTANSTQELRDISLHQIKQDNPYVNPRDWYTVINNCNNLINRIDTTYTVKENNQNIRILKREMAVAKTIRAWSYMQLFFNYGRVEYTDKTILDVEDQDKAKVITDFTVLSSLLIDDLTPFVPADGVAEVFPGYGSISDKFEARKLFIPVRFILGELYLWRKEYETAASMYYQLLFSHALTVSSSYRNVYHSPAPNNGYSTSWTNQFSDATSSEMISKIAFTDTYGNGTGLYSLAQKSYMIAPSSSAIENWDEQTYVVSNGVTYPGDLRGIGGSYRSLTEKDDNDKNVVNSYITKYNYSRDYVTICRSSLVYLRYAEAINRYGKPFLAFMVLKEGLNGISMKSQQAAQEIESGEKFIDFGQNHMEKDPEYANFIKNTGVHSKGCNNVTYLISYNFPADEDSTLWVENRILNEYALESAFEGNRFQDLMRIASHRDSPQLVAEKVSSKYSDAAVRNKIYALLSSKENWYIGYTE